jgi:hypothetical protein
VTAAANELPATVAGIVRDRKRETRHV